MSWLLVAAPLRDAVAGDQDWEWLATSGLPGVPDVRPTLTYRLTVADVADAFREVDAAGDCWSTIAGQGPYLRPRVTPEDPGLRGLGEVTIHAVGRAFREPIEPDDLVDSVGFRSPDLDCAPPAVWAIARRAPIVVMLAEDMQGLVIDKDASLEQVITAWPW